MQATASIPLPKEKFALLISSAGECTSVPVRSGGGLDSKEAASLLDCPRAVSYELPHGPYSDYTLIVECPFGLARWISEVSDDNPPRNEIATDIWQQSQSSTEDARFAEVFGPALLVLTVGIDQEN